MKIEFKFLPVVVTSYVVRGTPSNAQPTKNCIPYPCFRCKHYLRREVIKLDIMVIDVDRQPLGMLEDGCNINPGFNNLGYDSSGTKATCGDFEKDYSIARKL